MAPDLEDCGVDCELSAGLGWYYSCQGTKCTSVALDRSAQVQNPVAHLQSDNNGIVLQLPDVPPEGASSIEGSLILGIGTQSNNSPSGVVVFPIDSNIGGIITSLEGSKYAGFFDTGSNALFFPVSTNALPPCSSPNQVLFCPSSTINFSATNTSAVSSAKSEVSFSISNFDTFTKSFSVSAEIGGLLPVPEFDWGLPFHFGRTVYVGIDGKSSSLGQGPFWAY